MKEGIKTIQILKKIRDASSLKIHTSLIQDTECTITSGHDNTSQLISGQGGEGVQDNRAGRGLWRGLRDA